MATPGFFLYGSSPDQLAAQQAGYEQRFTSAAEGNRNAAAEASRSSLSAFLQAQAADEQARQFDARNRIAAWEEQRRMQQDQQNQAENTRRYNLDFGLRKDAVANQNDINQRFVFPQMQAQTDLTRTNADNARQYNPIALKQMEFSHARAEQDASDGNIESVSDALKKYPGLTQEDAINYFQKSQQARNDISTQVNQLSSAAKTLNAYEDAKRNLAAFPTGNAALSFQSALEKLAPAATALQNPKAGIMQQLSFDPDSGKYTPNVPKLSWLKSPSDSTEADKGKMLAFFKNFSGTPAPTTTATASPNVGQQYITGRRYGNLRYLGGDPNDQRNWQQVQ